VKQILNIRRLAQSFLEAEVHGVTGILGVMFKYQSEMHGWIYLKEGL